MKKIIKKLMAFGVVFVLGLSIVGCGLATKEKNISDSTTFSKAQNLKTVKIGTVGQNNVFLGAIGIADKKGFLKEELEKAGYEPEIVGFAQAGPAINEAFAAGDISMAIYGDLPAIVAKSNGTDTTIFGTFNSEEQMGIFVRKGIDDIKSAKDLPGHKVIVARGTIYHHYFKALIADADIKESEIDEINTFSDATSLIASGDADVLITSTAIAYYLESQGYGTLIEDTTKHDAWTSQFFAVGLTSYLKENPEAAKAIIKAMLRGQEYVKKNPDEAYKIWDELSGYGEDIYKKVYAYDTSFDYLSPEFTDNTVMKLEDLQKFLLQEKLITNKVDMKSFVDNRYYGAAEKEYDSENK
ncbi:MAG: ABC transporter substrate-binding protein [Lachnospiraceae bacterium]|nr:ABC transporter substrate-binding protein [Lachnospiraceae bacterium]